MRDWEQEYAKRGAVPLVVFPHHAFQVHTLVPDELDDRVLIDGTSTMSATYGVAFQTQFRQGTLPWSARPAVLVIDRDGVLRYADDYEDREPLWTPLELLDDLQAQRSLIDGLREDAALAEAAAIAVEPCGDATASSIPALIGALRHGDADVRAGAAAALYWTAAWASDAVPALAGVLRDGDDRVRRYAALALGRIGKPAEREMVAALKSADHEVRLAAARHLTSFGGLSDSSLQALIRATRDDVDRVRMAAVRSLVRLPLERRIQRPVLVGLARSLADPVERIRHDAAYGMMAIQQYLEPVVPAIAEALEHEEDRVRVWGAIVLRSLGPAARPAMPALLHNAMYDVGNPRNRARDVLRRIGGDAHDALLASLRDGGQRERAAAANVLGHIHPDDPRVRPALIESLTDPSRQVRTEAATALGNYAAEAKDAVDALNRATRDRDPQTRQAAQFALQKIRGTAEGEPPPVVGTSLPVAAEAARRLDPEDGPVRCADFTPNGERIAVGGDRRVTLFEIESGDVVWRAEGHQSVVTDLDISSDGRWLVTGSKDRTVRVWNMKTGEQLASLPADRPAPFWSVAFSPDGRLVAAATADRVTLWDRASTRLVATADAPEQAGFTRLRFAPRGDLLAVGGDAARLDVFQIVDGAAGAPLALRRQFQVRHQERAPLRSVAFSPDSRWMVTTAEDRSVRLWDTERGGAWLKLGLDGPGHGVGMTEDGSNIVAVSENETIQVWSMRGKLLGTNRGTDPSVRGMAVSPDRRRVATFGAEGVKLWELDQLVRGAPPIR